MSRILFLTWDGGGNLPPAVGVAHVLRRHGHDVAFLGHRRQADYFAREGLRFSAYPTAHDFDVAHPNAPWGVLKVFTDRALGRDAVARAGADPWDLVVVDCYLFGAMAALREAGIAYVTFEHTFDGYLRSAAHGPLGMMVRLRGLSPLALIDAGRSVITPTLPSLDAGHAAHVRHTGPVVSGSPATPAEPTVLISLSTVGFSALTRTWQRVLDAVADLPARVIMTTGPSLDTAALRVPDAVEVHPWLAHSEVMPEVSVVLTHGGHATAMVALAHDLPMLVLPVDAKTDQPTIGATLSRSGAAITLSRRSPASRIRAALETLLADGPHRDAAARLGADIRAMRGAETAAAHLESLATETAQSRQATQPPQSRTR
ncbi:glycosyltransferase [Gordonia crocea]|uniref:Glycosyl transferase n=1 Tax=Gordonia crocea TaxID=589162 RepID=A0A7M3STW6_9ACTN|nr:glycosyltransferase [Gordonia crocea]GED96090.1 glycosyl transferase [Gordonia crocea]